MMKTTGPSKRLGLLAAGIFAMGGLTLRSQTLYVSSYSSGVVEKYSATGMDDGSFAIGDSGVNGPNGSVFNSSGDLFVSMAGGSPNNIEEYSPTGIDLGSFASTGLNNPMGLTVDGAGNIYAANFGSNTIEEFSPTGTPSVFFDGSLGGQLGGPTGLKFGPNGNLYVVNYFSQNIWEFSPTGADLGMLTNSNISSPGDIAITGTGQIFVTNQAGAMNIEEYNLAGADLETFATGSVPLGLAFDQSGDLFVTNRQSGLIVEYNASGGIVNSFASGLTNPTYIAVQPGIVPVPEPSAWAMMAGALVMGAAVWRRRGRAL